MGISQERLAAKQRGMHVYISQHPCRKGHLVRSAFDGHCVDCQQTLELNESRRIRRNEQARAWRASHPEATKDWVRDWQIRNPDKMRANSERYTRRKKEAVENSGPNIL
jgi:hypothetical protein